MMRIRIMQSSTEIGGLYVAFVTVYFPNPYTYQEYYLFLPGGIVYNALPKTGMLDEFDIVKARKTEPLKCGFYTLTENQVKFHWPFRRTDQQHSQFKIKKEGNSINFNDQTYYRVHYVDHLFLDGRYESLGFALGSGSSVSTGSSFIFTLSGHFTTSNATSIEINNSVGSSHQSTGAGTYSIKKTTLELQFNNGTRQVHTFFVFPENKPITSQPEIIFIDDFLLTRSDKQSTNIEQDKFSIQSTRLFPSSSSTLGKAALAGGLFLLGKGIEYLVKKQQSQVNPSIDSITEKSDFNTKSASLICSICGQNYRLDAHFCPHCGNRI